MVIKLRYHVCIRRRFASFLRYLEKSICFILDRITRLTLILVHSIVILNSWVLMFVFHYSKQFWNRILRKINCYWVTLVVSLGFHKGLSFVFNYSSDFASGLNVVSQVFVFHDFDVLLSFTVFGESVFW